MEMLNQINDIMIAPHFNLSEFACPCCRRVMLHPLLLEKLEKLRKIIKKPIHITSGYRCFAYNRKVGGVANSYHCIGLAADIKVKDINLIELLGYAEEIDFTGIGFYEKKSFLHLDVRPTKRTRWRE
jgi:uncharacterized protein YcbK (DUF882 family)